MFHFKKRKKEEPLTITDATTFQPIENENENENEINEEKLIEAGKKAVHAYFTSMGPLPPKPKESQLAIALSYVLLVCGLIAGIVSILQNKTLGILFVFFGFFPYVCTKEYYGIKKNKYEAAVTERLDMLFSAGKKAKRKFPFIPILFFIIMIAIMAYIALATYSDMAICHGCGAHCTGLLKYGPESNVYCLRCYFETAFAISQMMPQFPSSSSPSSSSATSSM